MARPKGIPKTGGREKGTPNKVTSDTKQWIQQLIDGNRKTFEKDLKELDSKDRLIILERMMSYVVPKMQSVDVKAQVEAEYQELEKLLEKAPDEAIERIEQRITELMNSQNEN